MRLTILLAGLLLPGTAAADSNYFGWGMSPGHAISGELAREVDTHDEVGGRVLLGFRRADTAFELSFFGTDMHPVGVPLTDFYDVSTLSLGLGVKQFVALHPNVELFARAGAHRIWVDRMEMDGWGLDYGAGIEAGSRPGGLGGRVWIDLGRQHARLDRTDDPTGVTFTSITAGVSVLWGR